MNDDDKIEYVDYAPAEINWFRLELPFSKPESDPWFAPNGLNRTQRLSRVKVLMSQLGFLINVDFKIASDYYSKNVVLLLHPSIEKYASWITLNWK